MTDGEIQRQQEKHLLTLGELAERLVPDIWREFAKFAAILPKGDFLQPGSSLSLLNKQHQRICNAIIKAVLDGQYQLQVLQPPGSTNAEWKILSSAIASSLNPASLFLLESQVTMRDGSAIKVWAKDLSIGQYRSGKAGRPTGKKYYMEEFQKRVRNGQIADTITKEAEYLHQWLMEHHPEVPPIKRKSIAEAIRKEYNEAKSSCP